MTHYDILHFFCSYVKDLHIVSTPPFLLGGRLNSQPSFQKEKGLAERHLFLFRFAVNVKSLHIVYTPAPFLLGELNFQPNFQNGAGLGRTSTFREGCWERGDDFFQGGNAVFTHKKLKCEIFNNKKSLRAKIFFSVITNNSNREISPKDLVTFKR